MSQAQAYFGSMLQACLLKSMLLGFFVRLAHASKASKNAQASVHALHMVHAVPLPLSFTLSPAER